MKKIMLLIAFFFMLTGCSEDQVYYAKNYTAESADKMIEKYANANQGYGYVKELQKTNIYIEGTIDSVERGGSSGGSLYMDTRSSYLILRMLDNDNNSEKRFANFQTLKFVCTGGAHIFGSNRGYAIELLKCNFAN